MGIHRAWESEKLWPSRVVGTCVLTEADAIGILCAFLGGEPEVYQSYEAQDGQHWAYVDCLTERHAVEVGLDRRYPIAFLIRWQRHLHHDRKVGLDLKQILHNRPSSIANLPRRLLRSSALPGQNSRGYCNERSQQIKPGDW